MKPLGAIVLTTALLALSAGNGRTDDNPEPPPPVKVSATAAGVKVKVSTAAGGPLLVVEGRQQLRSSSFQLELPEKNPPSKITLRFKDTDRLAAFYVMSAKAAKTERALFRITGTGKQTAHFDDRGGQLTSEKGARLSITYAPGKDQVEVVMVRHKGKDWPKAPFRVLWAQTIGKKKG
jgi:hypothetical protein